MVRTYVLAVFMLVAAGCHVGANSTGPVMVEGWQEREVSVPGPMQDRRAHKQDLAWMGANRFMAAWISSKGQLSARFYNVDGNWESEARLLQNDAKGVQALASGPIDRGPCVYAPPRGFHYGVKVDLSTGPGTGTAHEFRSFLAVQSELDLRIYMIDWCSGFIDTSVAQTIVSAKVGALAGGQVCLPLCTQSILVVYERQGVRGRFIDGQGGWTSPEFIIDGEEGLRYIDITWNPVGQRFFIGYTVVPDATICTVKQAAVTLLGAVPFVRTVNASCDAEQGGHRSSSSTDVSRGRNPTGKYLWYFQPSGNQVHLMDNAGNVISPLDISTPLPVALGNLHEAGKPSYAASARGIAGYPLTNVFMILDADGSIMSTQPQGHAGEPDVEVLGVEALASKVVTATGLHCTYFEERMCASWFISVYDL